MAIAYRSVSNTNIASIDGAASTVVITKPSGLSVGDWMIAIIGITLNETFNTPSGWTKLGQVTSTNGGCLVAYGKIADSADAAATNFTFTPTTTNGVAQDVIVGTMICGTGTSPVISSDFIDFGSDTDGGTTATFTGGVNPIVGNSLLIMGVFAGANNTGAGQSLSNYAITTSNPTWTERQDNAFNQTDDYCFGVATAPRTESTATGNFTADQTGNGDVVGVLYAVIESTNVTVTPAVISTTLSMPAPSISAGANVSTAVVTAALSVPAPSVSITATKWRNTDKSSASSFTNTDKS